MEGGSHNWHKHSWKRQWPWSPFTLPESHTFAPKVCLSQGLPFFLQGNKEPPPTSATPKNLFSALAETIAQTLKISSCCVCGGKNTGDHGPWQARELDLLEFHNETTYPQPTNGVWLLKTAIIGKNCLVRQGGQFSVSVGSLTCFGERQRDCIGSVGKWHIPYSPRVGQGHVCWERSDHPSSCSRCHQGHPERPEGSPDWRLEGWWMAPRTDNSILWACHLDRGWLLGIPHP